MRMSNVGGDLRFEHGLTRAAAARFFVRKCDRVDAAHEVRKRRIHQQIFERLAVRGADELHAALGDRASGHRFLFRADLVDDDDLRHVILDGFDHHVVLLGDARDLHAACVPDAGVRDIARRHRFRSTYRR